MVLHDLVGWFLLMGFGGVVVYEEGVATCFSLLN